MLQNSSKVNPSPEEVLRLMWVLWINSQRSSSLMGSWSCLATVLNSSKSMIPFSSLSNRLNTVFKPSLVLVSPTLEAIMSTNSSHPMGLFFSFNPLIKVKMKGFLFSNPSSSKTLLIQTGSIVPLPSSSKMSKVCLSSSQSSAVRRSFQEVRAGLATFPEVVAGLAWLAAGLAVLLIKYQISQ